MAISQVFVEVVDVFAHLRRAGEEKPSDSLALLRSPAVCKSAGGRQWRLQADVSLQAASI